MIALLALVAAFYESLSSPQIAPDGSAVVYASSRPDEKANRFRNELWLIPASGGEAKVIGEGSAARWSPDGKRVAYLADSQVHVDGRAITNVPGGVQAMEWSPDGSAIAFLSTGQARAATAARDSHVVGEEKRTAVRLYVQKLGGDAVALTGESISVEGFAWSPDGSQIAFGAAPRDDDEPWRTSDLYVVDVAGKAIKQLTNRDGFDSTPLWSPDGKRIAYLTSNVAIGEKYSLPANAYIAVIGRDGSGDRVLSRAFDEDPSPVAWIGDAIYFQAQARTDEQLYRLNVATGAIAKVTTPGVFREFSISADGKRAAFVVARSGALPEIAISDVARFAPRILTRAGDALRGVPVSSREVISWTASDGTPIEGVLVKPPGFDPAKRYPLLVVLHTGPQRTAQPVLERELPYPVELFATRGAVVLEPNYRGSAGYGERFRKLLVGQLGVPEVDDVMTGVDALIAKGFIDPARMGAMGWSHGGYIAAMIATSTDRFAAVSVGAGVSDWQTYYTQSDGGSWAVEYHHGTPWEVPEAYRASAPLTYVKKARTPTLIQHGERDRRAPIASAYELRRALLDQGVRVKMIVYDNAGHAGGGFTLSQLREVMEHNVEWFASGGTLQTADGRNEQQVLLPSAVRRLPPTPSDAPSCTPQSTASR